MEENEKEIPKESSLEKLRETPSIFEIEQKPKKEDKPKTLKAVAISGLKRKNGQVGFNLRLGDAVKFYPSDQVISQVFISVEDFNKL